MGNYSDFETEFVQRTLALIDQYNEMIKELGKPFREQYNYTLTLNCLLGLIVMPKERALSFRLDAFLWQPAIADLREDGLNGGIDGGEGP